jgi:hypothetical protein
VRDQMQRSVVFAQQGSIRFADTDTIAIYGMVHDEKARERIW